MKKAVFVALLLVSSQSFAMTYFLVKQWRDNAGNNLSQYGNGTVLNVGIRLCPLSVEG